MSTQANLQATLDAKVAEIRSRTELTPIAQRARIAAAWQPLKAEAAKREQASKAQHDAALQKAKRAVFSLPSPTALDNLAHRAALESIKSVDDPKQVANLLDQAKMSGDPTLTLAVRQRAFEMSGHGLADQQWAKIFSDSVVGDSQAFDAAEVLLAERKRGPLPSGTFDNMLVPPSELGNAADYEVQRFLNEDPSVEAGVS